MQLCSLSLSPSPPALASPLRVSSDRWAQTGWRLQPTHKPDVWTPLQEPSPPASPGLSHFSPTGGRE